MDENIKIIIDALHNIRVSVIKLYNKIKAKIIEIYCYIINSLKGKDKDKIVKE